MKARAMGRGSDRDRQNYSERGIYMCPEWEDYAVFRDWALANGYTDELSVDRIDNDGPYEPSNCRWATVEQQANNRRNIRWITFNGETLSCAQWARKLSLTESCIYARLMRGVPLPDLLSTESLHHQPRPSTRGDNHWSHRKPESTPRGSRHWSTDLTEDQVREIRRRHAAGGTKQVDLAAEYGVTKNRINGIIKRRAWKHVE